MQREHTSANLMGAMERHGMGGALECTPTKEIRAELIAAGVPSSDDEIMALSRLLNQKIEEKRHDDGKAKSSTFYNLFKEVRDQNEQERRLLNTPPRTPRSASHLVLLYSAHSLLKCAGGPG